MTPAQRIRAAALRGNERFTASRDTLRLMHEIDTRPPVRVTARCIRPRTRVRLERWGAGFFIFTTVALFAAVFFLGVHV